MSGTLTMADPHAGEPQAPKATAMVIAAATRAAVLTAQQLPDTASRWVEAVHATARALIHRLAVAHGLDLAADELPYTCPPEAEAALDEIGPLAGWTPLDIGDVHQEWLRQRLVTKHGRLVAEAPRGSTSRDLQGAWYTPRPLARETSRLALAAGWERFPADDPAQLLRLRVVDPACGAGVILVQGARLLAGEYARRLAGTPEPPPHLMRKVLPEVIHRCVFGIDIDPVAVDLARASLWLEADGAPPFGWLDGNVACLDPLAAPNSLPDRLLAVLGEQPLEPTT